EALPGKALVAEQRRAEVAEADQRDRPLAVESEDLLQLGLEPGHVVADAPHPELAEVGEVLAHLGRVEVEALGQLLGRYRLHSVLLELLQAARVDGETADRHLRDLRQPIALTPRHTRAPRGRRPSSPFRAARST